MRGRLSLLACLVSACVVGGGSTEDDPFRLGLWPLYTADALPWAGVRESRALGPVLHWEIQRDRRLFEARPLYSTLSSAEARRRDLLFPISGCRETPDRWLCSLVFLASHRSDLVRHTTRTHLLVGFWGKTEKQQLYGGLFPLAGVFKERFGRERIGFLLWPLFARAKRDGFTETHLLWPFFGWGSGGGRSMLRIWPLYGVSKREGVYTRRFFLWPLIHRRAERLDADTPADTFLFLPLYGRRDTGPQASRFFLFPLFLKQWNRQDPGVGRIDLVWPLYSKSRHSDGSETLAIRPFYFRSRRDDHQQTSFLSGLVGRTGIHEAGLNESSWQVLWIGRIGTRRQQDREVQRVDLWPLYRWLRVREPDGHERGFLRVPYLIPLRGLEPDGWNRNYNQFFELYGVRWRDGEMRSSLFFGLHEVRRSAVMRWESWAGFLHFRRHMPVDLN